MDLIELTKYLMNIPSVSGEGLRASTSLAAKVFSAIHDVNIALVSHGASSVNLTFVVREELVADVIKRLHNELF